MKLESFYKDLLDEQIQIQKDKCERECCWNDND